MEIIQDIICQIYAGNKSKKIIYKILHEFIPGYEKLNLDYTSKIDDEAYVFLSEKEMIEYFMDQEDVQQTFYWNKSMDNPDRVMVGANITKDNKLIMSLTFTGTEATEKFYFEKLRNMLKSSIGVVSYVNPAEYEDGKDFVSRYS